MYERGARRLGYAAPRRTIDDRNAARRAAYARGRRHAAAVAKRAEEATERRLDAEAHASRELRSHPTARLLLAIGPRLSDEQLRSGVERARVRWMGILGRWRSANDSCD